MRTLRKGSSDHLAINIESETERLINDKGSDEDKGEYIKKLSLHGKSKAVKLTGTRLCRSCIQAAGYFWYNS